MPSMHHELCVQMFRDQKDMTADLMHSVFAVELPAGAKSRVFSSDFTEMQPTEYRADLVLILENEECARAIIVEVQLQANERKRFVWPAYVATLRARLECAVYLLVVASDNAVGRWAEEPIDLGCGSIKPYVLSPANTPRILDENEARGAPELAMLSAIMHGKDPDAEQTARIALAAYAAWKDMPADRSRLYIDLLTLNLSEAARQALESMDAYKYQSEFARRYVAEGELSGRAALLSRQLTRRFGALGDDVRHRLQHAGISELDAIGDRLLDARTLQEALG